MMVREEDEIIFCLDEMEAGNATVEKSRGSPLEFLAHSKAACSGGSSALRLKAD